MSARPKLLLADPNPATRLAALDALGKDWEVIPLPEEEDPVRVARKLRPAVLALAVPQGRVNNALRACRSLKTEANPPRVALLDHGSRISDPTEALAAWLADGITSGAVDAAALPAFFAAVVAGEKPVLRGTGSVRGLLGRLLGR